MQFSLFQSNKSSFYTFLIYFSGVLGLGLVLYFGASFVGNLLNFNAKAGLVADVLYGNADVYVNGTKLGTTPFENTTLKPGENEVKLVQGDRSFVKKINFIKTPNTIYYVNVTRDMGVSDIFSSGRSAWYEKADSQNTLSVVTQQAGATVFIDGTEVGKTPFSTGSLTPGTYTMRVEQVMYESQTLSIKIQKGYTLNVAEDLFPQPVTSTVPLFEGSTNLYSVFLDNTLVTADTQSWVNAVIYWNKTRGLNVDGKDLVKDVVFDFYLDYRGDLFNKDGKIVSSPTDLADLTANAKKGLYLGRVSDGAGLTVAAKQAYEAVFKNGLATGKTAKVLATPTGWLRVRDSASINGVEITKVNTGETYNIIEQGQGWVKIKVSDTISGWVSTDYVSVS